MYHNKDSIVYNTSGQIAEIVNHQWILSQWGDPTKKVYTYSGNQLTSEIHYKYESGVSNLVPYLKINYSYNSNNEIIQHLEEKSYDGILWENEAKIDLTYSPSGRTIVDFIWTSSGWEPYMKIVEQIDQVSNLTDMEVLYWDLPTQTWIYDYVQAYTYDNNYPYALLVTTLPESQCRHQILTLSNDYFDTYTGQFVQNATGTFYWSDVVPASAETVYHDIKEISAYPNPTTEILYFELPESAAPSIVELYNASGQRVISQQLTDNALKLTDLPTGFYSYRILQEDMTYSGKVIIE